MGRILPALGSEGKQEGAVCAEYPFFCFVGKMTNTKKSRHIL